MITQPDIPQTQKMLHGVLSLFDLITDPNIQNRFTWPEILLDALKTSHYKLGWQDLYECDIEESLLTWVISNAKDVGIDINSEDDLGRIDSSTISEKMKSLTKAAEDSELVAKAWTQRNISFFLGIRCLFIAGVCQLHYRNSIRDVIREARNGDKESIYKLVKLDQSFLAADFVIERIVYAELSRNREFQRRLAAAIRPDPDFWLLKTARRYFALYILSLFPGYATCGEATWSDVLAYEPLDLPSFADPENVRKAREYYGLQRK